MIPHLSAFRSVLLLMTSWIKLCWERVTNTDLQNQSLMVGKTCYVQKGSLNTWNIEAWVWRSFCLKWMSLSEGLTPPPSGWVMVQTGEMGGCERTASLRDNSSCWSWASQLSWLPHPQDSLSQWQWLLVVGGAFLFLGLLLKHALISIFNHPSKLIPKLYSLLGV